MKTYAQEKADVNLWLQKRLAHLERHGASQQMINEAYGEHKRRLFEIDDKWEKIQNSVSKNVSDLLK